MTNPTTNFGWQMPTSTDLVTDLPADFEVFGQAVDTSLADLKGGTTGQVLSKASNTNMDFTWVTTDDANAIQNTIVDAKGDLISATGSDVPARLAVGANTAPLVADSAQSTGLRWDNDAWTTYTPVWTASVTNPTLGNGILEGWFKQRGKIVDFRVNLVMGSTTAYGSGSYNLSLPVTAKHAAVNTIIGNGYTIDNSAGGYYQIVIDTGDGNTKVAIRTFVSNATYATLGTVGATIPFTYANADAILFIGSYEAA
jgi:hypothetical protein